MKDYTCVCTYCGERWEKTVFYLNRKTERCPKCKDKHIKFIKNDKKDYYGYEEKIEIEDDDL